MNYLSVCSGIEAASVAWHPLGWQAVAFAEIDKFPSAVLKHHYPGVPNWGDLTKFREWPDAAFDVLVGGTPCQSFSVAGLRAGLADPRGNLALTYLAVVDRYRPRWVVWENVPGVLSADEGGALGAFLGGLGQLGYGFAYRVLDAQYFGLAQRRARVFVVGHLGDWRRAAAVLFERESLSGHPAPRRETGQRTAPTLDVRAGRSGETGFHTSGGFIGGVDYEFNGHGPGEPTGALLKGSPTGGGHPLPLAVFGERERALTTSNQRIDAETETFVVTHSLRADGFDASEDGTGRGTPLVAERTGLAGQTGRDRGGDSVRGAHVEPSAEPLTLAIRGRGESHDLEYRQDGTANAVLTPNGGRGGIGVGAVAFNWQSGGDARGLKAQAQAQALSRSQTPAMQSGMQVRRLTPRECERLQGFPDDYTLIPYRGKPAADGPRYKALGNSMAVPVMAWIGRRIKLVDSLDVAQDVAS